MDARWGGWWLVFVLSGCAVGAGRVPSTTDALISRRMPERKVVGGGKDYLLVTSSEFDATFPLHVSGGVMPVAAVMFPTPSASSPGAAGLGGGFVGHAELAFSPSARRRQQGAHVPTLALQYQFSRTELDYTGGFSLGATHHGVTAFAGWGFGTLALEGAVGALFGTLGLGSAGALFADAPFVHGASPAAGLRVGTRGTVLLFEGNMPGHIALRAEVAYQHLWATGATPPGVPAGLGALSFGVELVTTFF